MIKTDIRIQAYGIGCNCAILGQQTLTERE